MFEGRDLEMTLNGWHTAVAGCSRGERLMSVRVMTLVGCLVFVPGFMMFWPAPAATSQPVPGKLIGSSAVRHGGSSSAGQPRSRMDRPDAVASCEELDMQRR